MLRRQAALYICTYIICKYIPSCIWIYIWHVLHSLLFQSQSYTLHSVHFFQGNCWLALNVPQPHMEHFCFQVNLQLIIFNRLQKKSKAPFLPFLLLAWFSKMLIRIHSERRGWGSERWTETFIARISKWQN
jgi:hypothetical protein